MTESTKFAVRIQKKSIKNKLRVLFTMLAMTSLGMVWMTKQMPEGHMNKIFGGSGSSYSHMTLS